MQKDRFDAVKEALKSASENMESEEEPNVEVENIDAPVLNEEDTNLNKEETEENVWTQKQNSPLQPVTSDEPVDVGMKMEEKLESVQPSVKKPKKSKGAPILVRVLVNSWQIRDLPGPKKTVVRGKMLSGKDITPRVLTAIREEEVFYDSDGSVMPVVEVVDWI